MVGELNGEETRTMLMIKDDFERGGFSIPDPQKPDKPQYSLSIDLRGAGTKVKAKRSGDQVEIDVNLKLEVSYLSMKTQTDYTDPRNAPLAEKAVSDYIKTVMDGTILKCQKEFKSDVFQFGDKVRHTFLTWPEFERFAWLTKFPDATVRTHVDVRLKRYGLDLGPLKVPAGEIIEKKSK